MAKAALSGTEVDSDMFELEGESVSAKTKVME